VLVRPLADRKRSGLLRDSLAPGPAALPATPPVLPDSDALRQSIRSARADAGLLLGVLDDDPTGSQAVHGVQVVTGPDEDACVAALASPACFVLTNTRSLSEPAAASRAALAARCLYQAADRRGAPIQLISRGDSTLRGHLMAEVTALQEIRHELFGRAHDAVLLVPAFLEAGRLTAGGIHRALIGSRLVPVGDTEYARDPVFGYAASDLRDFIAEKSGGQISRDDVASIGLADIRRGGPDRVRALLADARDGGWIAVDATDYSDLETVAYGALLAERAGQSFLYRTGPSFVRALTGMGPKAPLRGADLWPAARRGQHGLIVVGSHVGRTSRQVAALRERGGIAEVELDVPSVLAGRAADAAATAVEVAARTARQVRAALEHRDVLLYTSREFVAGRDRDDSLAIGRQVSAVLSATVQAALAAQPAWVLAKGGITSHDVAQRGLGIRRAEVAGQLFAGMISVFRPVDAAPEAIGMPFVVFAGNVGEDAALAAAVSVLNGHPA
jgi:uncharacterized protein YgbK (DUF1537 family)